MIGQCPDGIDFHVRNLQWALTEKDHIFVITLPNFISEQTLHNSKRVTYIPFTHQMEGKFINFWNYFPSLFKDINPEWWLFTEEDILFFGKPILQEKKNLIRSFLPRGDYRQILLNGKKIHDRVWEGAQLIHNSIVKSAIDFGINFSFVKETFLDQDREKYEKEFGGKIELSMYKLPDTMDEFGLYCALVQKTSFEQIVKALHMRGPESVHRQFPEIYRGGSPEQVAFIQKKLPYLDIFGVVAFYYIIGLWKEIVHLDWRRASFETKREIKRLMINGREWMNHEEFKKLALLYRMLIS